MAASDVEDGEIVGEVNENYQRCINPRERHAAKREAELASAAGAQQQQLPGWDDELQAAGNTKRKPKKEKKKKQKDLAGQSAAAGNGNIAAAAAAAADAVGSQGQEATYVNVYGSNVSAASASYFIAVACCSCMLFLQAWTPVCCRNVCVALHSVLVQCRGCVHALLALLCCIQTDLPPPVLSSRTADRRSKAQHVAAVAAAGCC
jgi:hypothetical protein